MDIIYLFYSKMWDQISFIPLPMGLDELSDFSDSVGLGFFPVSKSATFTHVQSTEKMDKSTSRLLSHQEAAEKQQLGDVAKAGAH